MVLVLIKSKLHKHQKITKFGDELTINNLGGTLKIESRVSDKVGDVGHPIQFDSDVDQWYVTVGTVFIRQQSLF